MKQKVAKRLHDALAATSEISQFIEGETEQSYLSDRKLQLALLFLLTIVGESLSQARRDDPSLNELIPKLHSIVGMRNRIVHVYDDVDYRLLWLAVSISVPELAPQLEHALATQAIEADDR
ncbi:MAG TPA: HepT-like ribonuclease domain-containing protein [Thermomicrobiales bacterium]|nr:HepT-like ribonuclease domain-containing protein [Thermomicrobiales bacterium]